MPHESMARGADMRNKAMAIAMKRKEEYLGARVPKALKNRVIKKADEMNIPVSLLIRRLLEQTFAEDNTSANFSLDAKLQSGANPAVKSNNFEDIIGWKPIEVNQDRSCERCKEPLPKGSSVFLGFTPSEVGYIIVCPQCKAQLAQK